MSVPYFREALVKLAARCNLNCTYCYWFRDTSVYSKPPILTLEAEDAFLQRLEEHIRAFQIDAFSLILHGGEPLLFGKARFIRLLQSVRAIEERTHCAITCSLTTNGVLIDAEWAQLFRIFQIHVTVSVDGPADRHNSGRIDFKGRGSYDQVIRGLRMLQEQQLEPGVLAVCDPASDPLEIAHHFVDVLDVHAFDILIPDITYDDPYRSIAAYYCTLFDHWYDDWRQRGVSIRYLETLAAGLIQSLSSPTCTAYNPLETLTILTDGALEPVDVLRIAGNGSTRTSLSVMSHSLQDLTEDACWQEAYRATVQLPVCCQECEYRAVCGGGYVPHRWSRERQYDNPSVYCSDLKQIYRHCWERVSADLQIITEEGTVPLLALYREQFRDEV